MTYRDVVFSKNPVAYYRHGEASGTTGIDETANSNDGTYSGGILGATGALEGDLNTAWQPEGTKLVVPHSSSLALTGSITLEAWLFNVNPNNVQKSIIQKPFTSHSSPYYAWMLSFGAESGLGGYDFGMWVTLQTGGVYTFFQRGSGGITAAEVGDYLHLVGVWDATTKFIRLYVNGAQRFFWDLSGFAGSGGSLANFSTPLAIANYGNVNIPFGTGTRFDEVAVYGTALTAEQILENYCTGRPSKCLGFVDPCPEGYSPSGTEVVLYDWRSMNPTDTRSGYPSRGVSWDLYNWGNENPGGSWWSWDYDYVSPHSWARPHSGFGLDAGGKAAFGEWGEGVWYAALSEGEQWFMRTVLPHNIASGRIAYRVDAELELYVNGYHVITTSGGVSFSPFPWQQSFSVVEVPDAYWRSRQGNEGTLIALRWGENTAGTVDYLDLRFYDIIECVESVPVRWIVGRVDMGSERTGWS